MKNVARRRIVGLDALKFFAIVLVVIYHCFPGILPGGFIAVDIFFVISGFLIGKKLVRANRKERNKFGGWKSFWRFVWERLKRFLPMLLFCMILTLSLAYFADPDLLTAARPDSLYAVTFSTNIMSIVNGSTYENSLIPNLFNQTWFLALELQICIICFLVMAGFFKLKPVEKFKAKNSYRGLMITCIVIAVLSSILMGVYGGWFRLYDRAYFGPDSHIGAFFVGAAMALFTFMRRIWPAKKGRRWIWMITLALSLGLVVTMSAFITYASPEAFTIALPATSVLSAVMIMSVLKLQKPFKKKPALVIRILEYIGTLSFAIYLLHYGLNILLPSLLSFWPLEVAPWIAILLSVLIAILLDKVIIPFSRKHKVWFAIILLPTLILPVMSLIKAPEKSSIEESLNAAVEDATPQVTENTEAVVIDYSGAIGFANLLSNDVMKYFDETEQYAKPYPVYYYGGGVTHSLAGRAYYNTPDYSRASALSSARVMVLGDSVVVGATVPLYNTVPGVFVDAMQSRNMTDAINLLAGYRSANGGKLPYIIVLGLVTNYYPFGPDTLQAIMDTAGPGHQFVFMTGYCGDYSRVAQNNVIKSVASSRGNVHVGDWAATVVPYVNSYTYADHTHLTPAGRQAYANLVNSIVSGL